MRQGFTLLKSVVRPPPRLKGATMSASRILKEVNGQNLMQRVRIIGLGGYDKLRISYDEEPQPGLGQIKVRVNACGLNFADIYLRHGLFPNGPTPPFVPGLEAAGVVEHLGPGVSNFKIGDRVICHSQNAGMFSEVVCLPQENCYNMPDSMSFDDGAALIINYLTAYLALNHFGNLQDNQTVFIHSVAGGVGWAATQLAQTKRGVRVFGTTSHHKEEDVLANGVNRVFSYENYHYELKAHCKEGVDIFLDNLSGSEFTQSQQLLRPLGKLIHLGAKNATFGEFSSPFSLLKTWWGLKHVSILSLIACNRAICGFNLKSLHDQDPERIHLAVPQLLDLYTRGVIRPRIDSVWPFSKVISANRRISERQNIGKVLLVPDCEFERRNAPKESN